MRKLLYRLVKEALEVPQGFEDRIFAAGSIREDNLPTRPFAVLHLGETTPGMGRIKQCLATIWIHDEGGDYGKIDDALGALYGRMSGAEHVSEPDGSAELILVEWQSNSGDLYDPGFRTLTKNTTYRLTGTGA